MKGTGPQERIRDGDRMITTDHKNVIILVPDLHEAQQMEEMNDMSGERREGNEIREEREKVDAIHSVY